MTTAFDTASSRRRILRLSIATALGITGRVASAQSQKPVRIIVPYAAGGGTDILARQFAEALASELGTPVLVENKPGGNGIIGGDYVAKSNADGTTLLMGDLSLAVNPALMKAMPFDPVKDLLPIASVGAAPLVLVVGNNLAARTVKELVGLARSRPGGLSYATPGKGSPPHLAGELFRRIAGVELIEIPYKGISPAITDVVGGQVSMVFTGLASVHAHIDSGRARALAVTGPRRLAALPDVPTMREAGHPAVDASSWWGLFAPAGTSPQVAEKLATAAGRVLEAPRLKGRLSILSIEAWPGNGAVLEQKLRTETARWSKVVAEARITPD